MRDVGGILYGNEGYRGTECEGRRRNGNEVYGDLRNEGRRCGNVGYRGNEG